MASSVLFQVALITQPFSLIPAILIFSPSLLDHFDLQSLILYDVHFQSITKAYGRVDAGGSRYLLGDHAGLLNLPVITHEKEK